MKPRIALDLDGVVYKWSDTARYLIRTHHGIVLGESTHWDYIKDNVPADVWSWLWTEGVALGMFRYGHLYRGAIEGARALAELGQVEVVTHRPAAAVHDTLRFLSYIELPLSGVHILTAREPKSSVGCDVYVDDAPHVVEDVLGAGSRVVMPERPWNTHVPEAFRVYKAVSWPDIVVGVREMLR